MEIPDNAFSSGTLTSNSPDNGPAARNQLKETGPKLYGLSGEAWIEEPGPNGRWIHEGVSINMEANRDDPPIPPRAALQDPRGDRGLDYLPTRMTLQEVHAVAKVLLEEGLSNGATRRGGVPIRRGARAVFTSIDIYSLKLPLERNGSRIPAPLESFGGNRTEAIWSPELAGVPMLIRGDRRSAETTIREDYRDIFGRDGSERHPQSESHPF